MIYLRAKFFITSCNRLRLLSLSRHVSFLPSTKV